MRRALLILAALAFVACAAVQLNDPDPEGWIAVYVGAVAASFLEALGQRRPLLPTGLGLVAGLWALRLGISVDGAALARGFGDEVLREIGGLLLVVGVMSGMFWTRGGGAAVALSDPGDDPAPAAEPPGSPGPARR